MSMNQLANRYYRNQVLSLLSFAIITAPLYGADQPFDRTKVVDAVNSLAKKQQEINQEIATLKLLLGVSSPIEELKPLSSVEGTSQQIKTNVDEGNQAFNTQNFELAKSKYQAAWEIDSNDAVANYNLGLAYHHLGNTPLAKKMLKSAIEINSSLEARDKITAYIEGKSALELASSPSPSPEQASIHNDLINLKKEADSYLRSKALSMPQKRKSTTKVLKDIVTKSKDLPDFIRDHYMELADIYITFEMFPEAIQLYQSYEKAMDGKVLPDDFYTKLHDTQQKMDKVLASLQPMLGQQPPKAAKRAVEKDLKELDVFAKQFEEFVKSIEKEDPDFESITKRLAEYRWGGKPNRHVMVVSKYQELLYSSLPGTLPIDRYQDESGTPFLVNITKLDGIQAFRQAQYMEVPLKINGETVFYDVLFTYIPKHESYIIVRFPKKDLG
jgi:tetratricopeptide (TPR) repeat protein